jgi:hypothetical protein
MLASHLATQEVNHVVTLPQSFRVLSIVIETFKTADAMWHWLEIVRSNQLLSANTLVVV